MTIHRCMSIYHEAHHQKQFQLFFFFFRWHRDAVPVPLLIQGLCIAWSSQNCKSFQSALSISTLFCKIQQAGQCFLFCSCCPVNHCNALQCCNVYIFVIKTSPKSSWQDSGKYCTGLVLKGSTHQSWTDLSSWSTNGVEFSTSRKNPLRRSGHRRCWSSRESSLGLDLALLSLSATYRYRKTFWINPNFSPCHLQSLAWIN